MKLFNQRDSDIRDNLDFYPTPKIANDKLFESGIIDGILENKTIWECCSGDGHISKYLENKGLKVFSSDINKNCYGIGNIDFLSINKLSFDSSIYNYDVIITNPPYKNVVQFVYKSLELANNNVIMLLKLTFLETQERKELFKLYPPKKILVLSNRLPHFNGKEWEKSGQFSHIWVLWEKGFDGDTIIKWI